MMNPKKKNDLPLILHLETSAHKCSVAVSKGKELLAYEERMDEGYVHAEALHVLIQLCAEKAAFEMNQLEAIHVSSGPGSYTGLRIGMSTAKGMAYALKVPLIATNTLKILAIEALKTHPKFASCIAMQDAGRMEVYAGEYDRNGKEIAEPAPLILSQEYFDNQGSQPLLICGDGAHKCENFLLPEGIRLFHSFADARQMIKPGLDAYHSGQFADTAYVEPLYVKDFEAGKPKNLLAS